MKVRGKVKAQCGDTTKTASFPDVPRAPGYYAGRRNRKEMDEHIKQRVKEINEKYSLDCCLLIVGNSDNIPDSLRELYMDATERGCLTVISLDYNYRQYKSGKIDAYDFMCALDALFTTLVSEFAEITEIFLPGSIERKEINYERS